MIVLSLLAMACGGSEGAAPTSDESSSTATPPPSPTPTPVSTQPPETQGGPVDLIAFVGPDDNIYTIKPDGSGRTQITVPISSETVSIGDRAVGFSNLVYNWPTWSPDAAKIAFTAFPEENDAPGSMYMVDAPGGLPRRLYEKPSDTIGRFVATRSPHYIYWSPDSQTLAFLAPSTQSLTLFLMDAEGAGNPRAVADGSPSYMAWSPDGTRLLHHLGDALSVVNAASEDLRTSILPPRSVAYRAPSWSADGQKIAYVDRLNGAGGLFTSDVQARSRDLVTTVGELGVFLWSPSANHLAYTSLTTASYLGTPTYDGLMVLDEDSSEQRQITQKEMLAFFWSPDGSKIAYSTLDRTSRTISWYLSDSKGNRETKLTDFIPSSELIFTMFAFFDQYAYSNSLWSPDGKSLVYTGRQSREDQSGVDKVWVVSAEGGSPPRAIAEGTLAFWSPR